MPTLIGTNPDQVPTNGDLGTMAFQDSTSVIVGSISADAVSSDSLSSEVITENGSPVVVQTDIGTAFNEIPLNQYLGEMAYMDSDSVVIQPQASAVPNGIGDMVFQLTSDTSLEIKVKGSDGTVRSVALTLA